MQSDLEILSTIPERWNDNSSLKEFYKINNVKIANFEELISFIGEAITSAINSNPELCRQSIIKLYNLTDYRQSNLHRLIANIATKHQIIASRATSFDDLPIEIKFKIASLLPQVDLENLNRTCHSNRSIVTDVIVDRANLGASLSSLGFKNKDQAINFSIKHQLRAVDFYGFDQISDSDVQKLTENSNQLIKLYLNGWEEITDHGLAHLAVLSELQVLSLGLCFAITNNGLAYLSELPALQVLSLDRCKNITDDGLAHLARMRSLKEINLQNCKEITDRGLAQLVALPALKKLDLSGCNKITDDGLAYLAELPALQVLSLDWCNKITDRGLAQLVALPALKKLDLRGFNKITDDGLMHIAAIRTLENLNLSYCVQITDDGLMHIARIEALENLNLSYCVKITDDGLMHMARIRES